MKEQELSDFETHENNARFAEKANKSNDDIEIMKILDMLFELKSVLNYTNRISLTGFVKKHGYTQRMYNLLGEHVVKNVGSKGTGARYEWNTIDIPNVETAKKVHYNYSQKYKIKTIPDGFDIKYTDISAEVKKTSTGSRIAYTKLFWGLITLKTVWDEQRSKS